MKKFLLVLCAACLVAATSAQSSVDVRIGQNLDDAEEFTGETSQGPAGTVYLDSSDLELFEDAGTLQVVGLRFENVTVPQGATVTAAYLQFTVDETTDVDTSVTLQGEANDNPALFAETAANISSRPRTSATVTWTPPPWTKVDDAGADQQSPDLTDIVQEIVDRPGWQSGNALAFILSGTGHRVARAFDGKAKEAALLHIDYEITENAAATDSTPATTPAETEPAEATPAEAAPATQPADNAASPAPVTPAPVTPTAAVTPAQPESSQPAPAQPATPAAQPAQPETATPSASPSETPRARQVRYTVSPVGDSRVRGSLFVADYGDNSLVLTLFATGQPVSDTYAVELVRGRCGNEGERLLALESVQGSKGGLSVTTVQMSFAALTNADLHVNLYPDASGSGAPIACGEVGAQ